MMQGQVRPDVIAFYTTQTVKGGFDTLSSMSDFGYWPSYVGLEPCDPLYPLFMVNFACNVSSDLP